MTISFLVVFSFVRVVKGQMFTARFFLLIQLPYESSFQKQAL